MSLILAKILTIISGEDEGSIVLLKEQGVKQLQTKFLLNGSFLSGSESQESTPTAPLSSYVIPSETVGSPRPQFLFFFFLSFSFPNASLFLGDWLISPQFLSLENEGNNIHWLPSPNHSEDQIKYHQPCEST